ncbi:PilZ domain-containing protein [Brevibacillus ginsengisoli]|uniref:PilZ domain-containing protein n=1 Tax=Brevibacillus ginsengisoli TaxID=363854 RepID=UPI003CEA34A6
MAISMEIEARRAFFRLQFSPPIQAEMTIVRVKGQTIETGNSSILIEDLSAGGLRFLSNLKIPVTEHIILEFQITLMGQSIRLLGYVVWVKPETEGIPAYGVRFTIDENKHVQLTQLLNAIALRQRKNIPLPQTPVYSGSFDEYFQEE